MKPKELLNYCGENYHSQALTLHSITRYLEEDCVVAYDKKKMGVIFVIKGKIKHFGYVAIKEKIYLGGHGYTFKRLDLNDVINLLGEDCNILNKDEWNKIKKKIILENLE